MSHAQLYRCNYRLEQWQWGMSLTLWHCLPFLIQSKARRVSEFIILSHARIVSRVRFGFGHLYFFLSVWYPQLISNKFATTSQWMSPVWRQGALWGFQATVSLVRTGCYRSMTNTVIIVHEKMFTKGESRPITQALNEREEQTQQHGTLKLFAPASIFKKGRKIKIQEQFSCVSLRRQVCFWICRAMFLQSAFRFGLLITVETLPFFPEVSFWIRKEK